MRREKREKEVARDMSIRDLIHLIVYSYWLLLTERCVVIGCLLIDLMMLIDTYRSIIVRFASPGTRGFLSLLLSLFFLLSLCGKRKPPGSG